MVNVGKHIIHGSYKCVLLEMCFVFSLDKNPEGEDGGETEEPQKNSVEIRLAFVESKHDPA